MNSKKKKKKNCLSELGTPASHGPELATNNPLYTREAKGRKISRNKGMTICGAARVERGTGRPSLEWYEGWQGKEKAAGVLGRRGAQGGDPP